MKYLFAIVITTFFVTAAFAQSNAKDDAALTNLIKQMTDAQLAYDAGALDRIFTSDYIEISPAGELDPREKVMGFYNPQSKPAAVPDVFVSELNIRLYGKLAIVIARLNYTVPLLRTAVRSVRATFVCRLEKGVWKIASAQYTWIREPAPKT
jgi:hypothetical protein